MQLNSKLQKIALLKAAQIIGKLKDIDPFEQYVLIIACGQAAGKQTSAVKPTDGRLKAVRAAKTKPKLVKQVKGAETILKARGFRVARKQMVAVYSFFATNQEMLFTPAEAANHMRTDKVESVGKIMRKLAAKGILNHDPDGRYRFA